MGVASCCVDDITTGKSTFLRQNAMICLLAQVLGGGGGGGGGERREKLLMNPSFLPMQMGSYVPAESATLGMGMSVVWAGLSCHLNNKHVLVHVDNTNKHVVAFLIIKIYDICSKKGPYAIL